MTIAQRVAERYSFKYQPKEKKKAKVVRITKAIRDATGLGRGTAENIADAIVRGREVLRLAIQKNWPIENGTIQGPKGTLDISVVEGQV